MSKIVSKNPVDGSILGEVDVTPVEALPGVFDQARVAQAHWATLSARARAKIISQVRDAILNRAQELAELVAKESSIPAFQALTTEVFPSARFINYYSKNTPAFLEPQHLSLGLLPYRTNIVGTHPLGVIAVYSSQTAPFFAPLSEVLLALLAGNAVVFCPDPRCVLSGLKIQEFCEEAGTPPNLIQTLVAADPLIEPVLAERPAKIFFRGATTAGKRLAALAAEALVPVRLSLASKNPLIVLSDANVDFAASAALWGAFGGQAQPGGPIRRLLVHEHLAEKFLETFRKKWASLSENDWPAPQPLSVETTRLLDEALGQGATVLLGERQDNSLCKPLLVGGAEIEKTRLYSLPTDESLVVFSTFRSLSEAARKANLGGTAVAASVITRNFALGEQLAGQLSVSSVLINETPALTALPELPPLGGKDGLLEFTNVRVVNKPRSRLFSFKSPWWFPYSPFQTATMASLLECYRRHLTDRLRAFPLFLWNLVQFLKRESRL